jgi:hypothetical protein
MMKGVMKWIVLAAILLFLVPAVSAFTVTSVTIDPSGSLTPGTPVMVSYKVQFAASSGETFPGGSELDMSTDLENPKWTWTLILDGVENPRPQAGGRQLSLSGFELAYPSKVDESIRVTLEGKAPAVERTTNKSVIKIQEVDSNGNIVESSKVDRTTMVINIGELTAAIAAKRTDLQTFRTHIDEKAAIGIDTAIAEAKYNDAKSKIDTAESLPTTQYATAFLNLDTATSLMADGEKALDKSWAESEVLNSQTPITNVDGVIAWFKGNKTTADLPELSPIIAKREIAVSYISTANDQIAGGDYAQARSKAAEAFAKGNESFTDALKLQDKTMHQNDSPVGAILSAIGKFLQSGILIIVVAVIAIVLIAVGVIIYRKRSRWDELG